jgi:hypothetical protein
MIDTQGIKLVMRVGELALSCEKGGIACKRLVKQIDPCAQVLCKNRTEAYVKNEILRTAIEFKSSDICGWALLDRTFLGGRELRLQLVGDAFGDLALDGEDIGQIAIVGLRPEVSVVAGIDQLRDHAHLVSRPLDAAFDHMRHAQLLRNLA